MNEIGETCLNRHLREFIFFSLQIFTCQLTKEAVESGGSATESQGLPGTPTRR